MNARRVRRLLVTVDLIRDGVSYRLAEPIREQGATVRSQERRAAWCSCGRQVRQYAQCVRTTDGDYHPHCAIKAGLLVVVGSSTATPAPPGSAAERAAAPARRAAGGVR